jgi:ssDNA-binding Zn-finger/Zn-ribbon topoisomerase 1
VREEGSTVSVADDRTCPQCGSHMVLRTARRGRNAGGQFWGCQTYPRCKGTLPAHTSRN